jgi:magnesium transporter
MKKTSRRKRKREWSYSSRPPEGSRPGTLVIPDGSDYPRVAVMHYDADRCEEVAITDVKELRRFANAEGISWVDVQGLGDESMLRTVAEIFHIHPLALEDMVHTRQRPKTEAYPSHQFIVLRMPNFDGESKLDLEQMSIFLSKNYVVTAQERYDDDFGPVRARIRRGGGPMRANGADYLAYAIIDRVVDGFYPVLESIGERIDALEVEVLEGNDSTIIGRINEIKKELLSLRRAVWPLRDAVSSLIRDPNPYVGENVRLFLRDVWDHCAQLVDSIETYRDLASNLTNTYLTILSNRTNEVMKILTIMASIFIPLTFIVGVYGMNFDVMPELRWRWGYAAVMGFMATVSIGLLVFFRRKGWLGGGGAS